jgi:hypothetical protein
LGSEFREISLVGSGIHGVWVCEKDWKNIAGKKDEKRGKKINKNLDY